MKNNAYLYDIIRSPLITEKATMLAEANKYVFKIKPDATKKQVKDAVEFVFSVSVLAVNTISIKGKTKRFRGRTGKRADLKKAVVTIVPGQVLNFAVGV
jgi:large subunit ribosomal protein L23